MFFNQDRHAKYYAVGITTCRASSSSTCLTWSPVLLRLDSSSAMLFSRCKIYTGEKQNKTHLWEGRFHTGHSNSCSAIIRNKYQRRLLSEFIQHSLPQTCTGLEAILAEKSSPHAGAPAKHGIPTSKMSWTDTKHKQRSDNDHAVIDVKT